MNWATYNITAVLYGVTIYFVIDQCVGMTIGSAIGMFARLTGDRSPERLKGLTAKSWIKPTDFVGTMFAAGYGGYSAALFSYPNANRNAFVVGIISTVLSLALGPLALNSRFGRSKTRHWEHSLGVFLFTIPSALIGARFALHK